MRSVFRRDKAKCWICDHGVAVTEASRDHIRARSHGGYDKARNYRLAHVSCNNARGNLTPEQVLQVRATLPSDARGQMVCQALRAEVKALRAAGRTIRGVAFHWVVGQFESLRGLTR